MSSYKNLCEQIEKRLDLVIEDLDADISESENMDYKTLFLVMRRRVREHKLSWRRIKNDLHKVKEGCVE